MGDTGDSKVRIIDTQTGQELVYFGYRFFRVLDGELIPVLPDVKVTKDE